MDPTEIDYTQLSFPDPPADRPFVAINMVMSADGRTVIDGTERGLGSKLDQRLMRELRVHFDVVMNGGATFRASGTSARLNDPGAGTVAPGSRHVRIADRRRPDPQRRPSAGARFFTDHGFEAVIYLSSAAPDTVRRRAGVQWEAGGCRPRGQAKRRRPDHMNHGARRIASPGRGRRDPERGADLARTGRRVLPHPRAKDHGRRDRPPSRPMARRADGGGIRQLSLVHARTGAER